MGKHHQVDGSIGASVAMVLSWQLFDIDALHFVLHTFVGPIA